MSKRPSIVFQAVTIMDKAFEQDLEIITEKDKFPMFYTKHEFNRAKKISVKFVKYCRKKYKIHYLNKIKPEMFNAFIKNEDKTDEKFNPKIAGAYYKQILKFQQAYNKQKKCNII